MILRRSAILMLGSVPLLASGAFSQTAVHSRTGWVLALGHGVLVGNDKRREHLGESDPPLVAATFWDDRHCRHPA